MGLDLTCIGVHPVVNYLELPAGSALSAQGLLRGVALALLNTHGKDTSPMLQSDRGMDFHKRCTLTSHCTIDSPP